MNNPWDIAPLPTKGDAKRDITATAKGHATSTWESMEVELSHLYAEFMGGPHDDLTVMARYGEKLNFKDRLRDLEEVAEKFFYKNPCQIKEGDFADIVLLGSKLSARRNEIVHSVIRPVSFDQTHKIDEAGQIERTWHYEFYLVPPTYTDRKYDCRNEPAFIYTSVEITGYETWFSKVETATANLGLRCRLPSYPPYGRKHASPDD